ncbi:MAG: hypothetical protein O3C40_12730 [Planctomycetota bacterium]|nr:hypothetical protein [Planctomycetota bacterium]
MSPILIGVTIAAVGRSHYVLYVLKRGNLASIVITWLVTLFVIGFWSWHWLAK